VHFFLFLRAQFGEFGIFGEEVQIQMGMYRTPSRSLSSRIGVFVGSSTRTPMISM